MSERRKVLEFFEEQKDFLREKVTHGIEQYRKGDAKMTVTDERGNPISGAKVKIVQKSHEFRFGANIFMLDELETEEKNTLYKKYFVDAFNMATLPFYWDALEPERGKPRYAKDSPKVYRRPSPIYVSSSAKSMGSSRASMRSHTIHFFRSGCTMRVWRR